MKALVTGGIGTVGKSVLERLARHGWEIRVLDRTPEGDVPELGLNIDYRAGDITQFDEVRDAVRGCDAIVHLAAIAHPMFMPPHELFHINVQGTYNVFEAAASEGISRIVQASSINAFGCFWGNRDIFPHYFPIDEQHPTATTDVYSFSKEAVEDIGAYYWRRCGISSLSLRFPGVWTAARIAEAAGQDRRQQMIAAIDEFAALPEAERQERLAGIRKQALAFRAAHNMEYPQAQKGMVRPTNLTDVDPLWVAYTFDRFNFWAYVDERDSAQSIEKGLSADFDGHHPLFINARENALHYSSSELVRLFFPETIQWKRLLEGAESLVSYERAKTLIGYEPEHII